MRDVSKAKTEQNSKLCDNEDIKTPLSSAFLHTGDRNFKQTLEDFKLLKVSSSAGVQLLYLISWLWRHSSGLYTKERTSRRRDQKNQSDPSGFLIISHNYNWILFLTLYKLSQNFTTTDPPACEERVHRRSPFGG